MIVALQPWHLIAVVMNLRQDDIDEFAAAGVGDVQRWACQRALAPGVSFTAMNAEFLPVACFGIVDDNEVGTAWLVAREGAQVYAKSMIKAFRAVSGKGIFRIIQANCRPNRWHARKLLEHLGFRHRGEIPNYYQNRNAVSMFSMEGS